MKILSPPTRSLGWLLALVLLFTCTMLVLMPIDGAARPPRLACGPVAGDPTTNEKYLPDMPGGGGSGGGAGLGDGQAENPRVPRSVAHLRSPLLVFSLSWDFGIWPLPVSNAALHALSLSHYKAIGNGAKR